MQTFKKVLIRSLSFLLCVVLGSSVFLVYAKKAKNYYPCKIDDDVNYIFCGASQCAMSIIPSVIDERLGVKSYNLSAQSLKFSAKYELLKNIIAIRNIDTVVMEISNDVLGIEEKKDDGGNNNAYKMYKEYLSTGFILKNVITCNFLQMQFNQKMDLGYEYIRNAVNGNKKTVVIEGSENHGKSFNRGYEEYETVDVTLSKEEIISTYNENEYELKIDDKNLEILSECIKLCRDNNVDVILIAVPISDRMIWQNGGMDKFYDFMVSYSAQNVCPFYDFNLLHARFRHYPNDEAFYNKGHLSKTGATQCSIDYCSLINKIEQGKDISSLFYSSYEEMRNDSPYMEYYDACMGTDHKNLVITEEKTEVLATEKVTTEQETELTEESETETETDENKTDKKKTEEKTSKKRNKRDNEKTTSKSSKKNDKSSTSRSTSEKRSHSISSSEPTTTREVTVPVETTIAEPTTAPYVPYEEPTTEDDFSLYDFLFVW